ncbi:hypothetical protein RHGRI_014317 [Rhododendron griersonianum]|uniref:Uncharacterized protein n=1 Tax=Rhododendron griersonianum TaxID=479676 RepID=A0AAV6K8V3_9ERIC|nr:hypothetical protein RHGRI_014317 [Rhododendron griersonianum]
MSGDTVHLLQRPTQLASRSSSNTAGCSSPQLAFEGRSTHGRPSPARPVQQFSPVAELYLQPIAIGGGAVQIWPVQIRTFNRPPAVVTPLWVPLPTTNNRRGLQPPWAVSQPACLASLPAWQLPARAGSHSDSRLGNPACLATIISYVLPACTQQTAGSSLPDGQPLLFTVF